MSTPVICEPLLVPVVAPPSSLQLAESSTQLAGTVSPTVRFRSDAKPVSSVWPEPVIWKSLLPSCWPR